MNENRRFHSASLVSSEGAVRRDHQIDLTALPGILWRGKWRIAIAVLLFLFAGGLYAFRLATPTYQATAELALKAQEETIITDIQGVLSGNSASSDALNTELDVITSRKLIGLVVDRLELSADPEFNAALRVPSRFSPEALIGVVSGLEHTPEPTPEEIRNQVIDTVTEALRAINKRGSLTFEITASTHDPHKSVRLANTLADLYIQNQLREKFDANERASEFLSSRAAELGQELEQAELELSRFREQAELVSPEELSSQSAQFKDVRDRVNSRATEVESIRTQLEVLRTLLAQQNWAALTAEADYPALGRALAAYDAGAGSQSDVERAASLAVQSIEARLAGQEAQLSGLNDMASRMGETIERKSEELIKLQQLEREAEATRLLYESFLSRLKETNIQRGLAQPDARMLSEAVPRPAASPQVVLVLAMAGVLGLVTGGGIVLAREAADTRLRTPEELGSVTGHVVLGTIPSAPLRRRSNLLGYLREKPNSAFSEAVRNLRTSILLSNIDFPPKVLMITSSIPGEGKTTLSISLALNMAGLGKRVLLMEGDIRRRMFRDYFEAKTTIGLLEAMEDHALLDRRGPEEPGGGVDILVGTKISVNAADLFSSQRFTDLLKAARERYDYVVIDTPPVLVVPDARVIGQHADAIAFAARWDSTSRWQILEGLEMFRTVGLKVSGLVMTQVDGRLLKRYGYGGRYGYQSYGSDYYES